MAFKLVDRAQMSVTGTPGTGDVTLAGPTIGFQSLSAAGVSDGDTFPYTIQDGANWELGVGTYHSSGTTFTRTTVRSSSAGGTTKIAATSAAIIYCGPQAEDMGGTRPTYEQGPFAPPDPSWFNTSASYSGLTVALATVAERGMTMDVSGATSGNEIAHAGRDPSGWGSSWAVTARMLSSGQAGAYPSLGIFAVDTSGKFEGVSMTAIIGVPTAVYGVSYSSNNGGYHATDTSFAVANTPTWFRLRLSGGNLYYGLSYDGLFWNEYSASETEYLGTLAYVGIGSFPNANQGVSQSSQGILITYYDEPDYPATGHTQ